MRPMLHSVFFFLNVPRAIHPCILSYVAFRVWLFLSTPPLENFQLVFFSLFLLLLGCVFCCVDPVFGSICPLSGFFFDLKFSTLHIPLYQDKAISCDLFWTLPSPPACAFSLFLFGFPLFDESLSALPFSLLLFRSPWI